MDLQKNVTVGSRADDAHGPFLLNLVLLARKKLSCTVTDILYYVLSSIVPHIALVTE
jgi:hypothetical protein